MSDQLPLSLVLRSEKDIKFYGILTAIEVDRYLKMVDPEASIVFHAMALLRQHDRDRQDITRGAEVHLRDFDAAASELGDRAERFLRSYHHEVVSHGEDTPISPTAEEMGRHAETLTALSALD